MDKQIHIFADYVEQEALNQFYKAMALPENVAGALMPDVHSGYTLPIGAVIKSKGKIFPSYVGYDIGCGVAAVQLDIKVPSFNDLKKIKDEILKRVSIGPNSHKTPVKEWRLYDEGTDIAKKAYLSKGKLQFCSLGGGNHFLELGKDENGFLWITVHSGSRGFGYYIAKEYMKLAAISNTDEERYAKEFEVKNKWKQYNPGKWEQAKKEFIYRRVRARLNAKLEDHFGLDLDSELGQNYLKDMNLALQFALDNRLAMIESAIEAIKKVIKVDPKTTFFVNRNHNHAEVIDGDFAIHRKGATHAEEGMYGVIPGNMKDGCFIVKGKGYEPALCSSSHGAGRVLSRQQAKQEITLEMLEKEMEGIITNLTSSTIDEAPMVYKDIFEVMEMQKDMVEVLYHIKPVLNIKG